MVKIFELSTAAVVISSLAIRYEAARHFPRVPLLRLPRSTTVVPGYGLGHSSEIESKTRSDWLTNVEAASRQIWEHSNDIHERVERRLGSACVRKMHCCVRRRSQVLTSLRKQSPAFAGGKGCRVSEVFASPRHCDLRLGGGRFDVSFFMAGAGKRLRTCHICWPWPWRKVCQNWPNSFWARRLFCQKVVLRGGQGSRELI